VQVLEQGKLVGRTQEWNISEKELLALVELGVWGGGVGGGV